jgi:hypothetical protein
LTGNQGRTGQDWWAEEMARLDPGDHLVAELREYAAVPIREASSLLQADPEAVLRRLHRHELGGLFVDGLALVRRLSVGRCGTFRLGGRP